MEGLRVAYTGLSRRRDVAVDGVDLVTRARERVGIVGESGSGKSTVALAALGLARGAIVEGTVRVLGQSYQPALRSMRAVRGRQIGLVLQDPLSSLNPVMPIGRQLEEVLVTRGITREDARARAVMLLERVGIAQAARRLSAYPGEFSGGMRQRVVIAMALMGSPRMLIADEPTTALDLRTQARVLQLLRELCDENGMSLLLISHDIGVVREISHEVIVLYAGRVVERGATTDVLHSPGHPYTAGLIASRPPLWGPLPSRLATIPGSPPQPGEKYFPCRFAPRCSYARPKCYEHEPVLAPLAPRQWSACHFAEEYRAGALERTRESP